MISGSAAQRDMREAPVLVDQQDADGPGAWSFCIYLVDIILVPDSRERAANKTDKSSVLTQLHSSGGKINKLCSTSEADKLGEKYSGVCIVQ